MSSSFTFLQYNNKSFENYCQSFEINNKSFEIIEDFKYKCIVVSVVTPYLLNGKSVGVYSESFEYNLQVFINLWNVSSNCKYFQYNPEVFKNILNIVSVVTANLLNKYCTTSSLRSSCKYFEYYCKSFEYMSGAFTTFLEYKSVVLSVVIANLLNSSQSVVVESEAFTTFLNINSVVVSVVVLQFLNSKSVVVAVSVSISDVRSSLVSSSISSNVNSFEYNYKGSRNLLKYKAVVVISSSSNSIEYIQQLQILGIYLKIFSISVVVSVVVLQLMNIRSIYKLLEYQKDLQISGIKYFEFNSKYFQYTISLSSNCKDFEYESVVVKSEVFTNLFEYKTVVVSMPTVNPLNFSNNCKCFEYVSQGVSEVTAIIWNSNSKVFSNLLNRMSVVVSLIVTHFLIINANLLNIRSIYKYFKHKSEVLSVVTSNPMNITTNLLNITANPLNGESRVFTNSFEYNSTSFEYKLEVFTKILNSKSEEFTNILKEYMSEELSEVATNNLNSKSEVFTNPFEYKPEVFTMILNSKLEEFSNILKRKQVEFTNLLKSKQLLEFVVTSKTLNITKNLLNISIVTANLFNKYKLLVVQKYLLIFLNISHFLNITANLLNLTTEVFKNTLNISVVTVNHLNIKSEIFKKPLNTTLLAVLGVTVNILNNKSVGVYCKSFEYESQVVSVLTANILNRNSEAFENVLNSSNNFACIEYSSTFFQDKSVVVSVVILQFLNSSRSVTSNYKCFEYQSVVVQSDVFIKLLNSQSVVVYVLTANILNRLTTSLLNLSVVTANLFNITANFLNSKSEVFESILNYYKLGVESIVATNPLNSKSEVFTNIFEYEKYLQIFGIVLNTYNCKSWEYKLLVFLKYLKIFSINITPNFLNRNANLLNIVSVVTANILNTSQKYREIMGIEDFEYNCKYLHLVSSNFKYFEYVCRYCKSFEYNCKSWEYKLEEFTNLSNICQRSISNSFTFLDYNWKSFEYKSVVESVVLSYFFKITANLLNKSVVTENLLNSKPEIFMKILNITGNLLNRIEYCEYKSEVFTNLLNTKLVIVSIVTANLFNKYRNYKSFEFQVRSIFKLLENYKPVVESVVTAKPVNNKSRYLPIFLHSLHFLNIRNIYKSLQYKSVVVNSEVFTNLLNTKSVIVSGVTINLLNIIENILNICKSVRSSFIILQYNCKSFKYKPVVTANVLNIIANIWNSNSEVFKNILNTTTNLLNIISSVSTNYKSFEYKSQVFTNLFNHNSGDVSVLVLHIFNSNMPDVITSKEFKNALNSNSVVVSIVTGVVSHFFNREYKGKV
ncbi:hypothetical protein L873DRAFT_1796487 [Choiromyces venosus 120613-1]|uniref:Uncharacterized protein n=1 Tax=Choiromyces venosus 120613-1 TaxID=1336337 RepID=A0A3N4IWR5_9PEZI|nr:hypothetical protein L873DRAFT_1796487 [Choiromyces venosus 120613-1]